MLDWYSVTSKFQLWRLFTTFFFLGPFSISFIFGMMMMYYCLSSIEAHF